MQVSSLGKQGGAPLRGLLQISSGITEDLRGIVCERRRRELFKEFLRSMDGKCLYASAAVRAKEPYFPIILRNDFNSFVYRHHFEETGYIRLPERLLVELEEEMWPVIVEKKWFKAIPKRFLGELFENKAELQRRLHNALMRFSSSRKKGQKVIPFVDYFRQQVFWRIKALENEEERNLIGPSWDAWLERQPDPKAEQRFPLTSEEEALRVMGDLARNRNLAPWEQSYLRWVALFGGDYDNHVAAYFELSRGSTSFEAQWLADSDILHQLLRCLDRHCALPGSRSDNEEDFLVASAEAGVLMIPPQEVPQLRQEFGRMCARLVREYVRRNARQISDEVCEQLNAGKAILSRMLDEIESRARSWRLAGKGGPISYISQNYSQSEVDVAARLYFKKACDRVSKHAQRLKLLFIAGLCKLIPEAALTGEFRIVARYTGRYGDADRIAKTLGLPRARVLTVLSDKSLYERFLYELVGA